MIEKFIKDGWMIVDVPRTHSARVTIPNVPIDLDDKSTKALHVEYSEKLWKSEFSINIAKILLPVIQQLIGPDVMVQYMPYLRIARPNKREDNIGYHKDTQYGQTPYELVVHIPFVDLDEKSAIRVISGSHLMPESAFIGVTPDGSRIQKGSIENHMGRPYMPKCLKVPDGMQTTALSMKVGQAAIFSPAIFHGQEVNEGTVTRISCDLRFVSSHHADKVRVGRVHAGYIEISKSPVEIVANKYYANQKI